MLVLCMLVVGRALLLRSGEVVSVVEGYMSGGSARRDADAVGY